MWGRKWSTAESDFVMHIVTVSKKWWYVSRMLHTWRAPCNLLWTYLEGITHSRCISYLDKLSKNYLFVVYQKVYKGVQNILRIKASNNCSWLCSLCYVHRISCKGSGPWLFFTRHRWASSAGTVQNNPSAQQARLGAVGPLIIESSWAKKRVSIGAPGTLGDPLVVQRKNWKSGWVPEDYT